MKKSTGLILMVAMTVLFTGCAYNPTTVTPDVMVNIPSANNAKWTMNANMDGGIVPAPISLYINGSLLAKGTLSDGLIANIKGTYEGHAVQAICSFQEKRECVVYVDGTQVATLFY